MVLGTDVRKIIYLLMFSGKNIRLYLSHTELLKSLMADIFPGGKVSYIKLIFLNKEKGNHTSSDQMI